MERSGSVTDLYLTVYREALPQTVDISISRPRARYHLSVTQLCGQMREEARQDCFSFIPFDIKDETHGLRRFQTECLYHPWRLLGLFGRGVQAIDRLPRSLRSEPTDIMIHADVDAWKGVPADMHGRYAKSPSEWRIVRESLTELIRKGRPHRLAINFSCMYYTIPFVNDYMYVERVECSTMAISESGSLDVFQAEIPVGNIQAAKAALTSAVEHHKEVLRLHDGHARCSIVTERAKILSALENAGKLLEVFLEHLLLG